MFKIRNKRSRSTKRYPKRGQPWTLNEVKLPAPKQSIPKNSQKSSKIPPKIGEKRNPLNVNTLYRFTGLTRRFRCFSPGVATQESDGGCDGSDAEMIGNGRRGGGTERDRDMEEDEDEGREERSSEGGGGGGFGGWRSHLLGGLTQRVKSWYWGARPLVSFIIKRTTTHKSTTHRYLFFTFFVTICFLFLFFSFLFVLLFSFVFLASRSATFDALLRSPDTSNHIEYTSSNAGVFKFEISVLTNPESLEIHVDIRESESWVEPICTGRSKSPVSYPHHYIRYFVALFLWVYQFPWIFEKVKVVSNRYVLAAQGHRWATPTITFSTPTLYFSK